MDDDCSTKTSNSLEPDVFKQYFKYYKNRNEHLDLSQVLDFCNQESLQKHEARQMVLQKKDLDQKADNLGLDSPNNWKIYTLKKLAGLLFIVNPFHARGQQYWIRRCMFDYPNGPNRTNNDAFHGIDLDLSSPERLREYMRSFRMLRWVTLGYHHNWDTKKYSEENNTPFPDELKQLTAFIARVLNFEEFNAEAAIVNFYYPNSTLSGHVDCSEFDLTLPLFSISFGQPAIFLLGGRTRADEPVAMYLRSGDVVVMADSVRLSYHAVPRILCEDATPWLSEYETDKVEWEKIMRIYLKTSRINVNVRQVFPCNK